MKLPKWLPRLPFGQYGTWVGHAVLVLALPAAIGRRYPFMFGDRLLTVAVLATIGAFLYRMSERYDKRVHQAAGNWNKPMDSSGVTPETDQWGDLLGPYTAAAAYWIAWLVML